MTDVQIPSPIVATRVAEADRLRFLPTYFGPSMLRMLRGEALVPVADLLRPGRLEVLR